MWQDAESPLLAEADVLAAQKQTLNTSNSPVEAWSEGGFAAKTHRSGNVKVKVEPVPI